MPDFQQGGYGPFLAIDPAKKKNKKDTVKLNK